MADNYWFPKMRQFVLKYVKSCINCQYYKNATGRKQGMLHPIEKTPVPFHTLHVDHLGPFVTSNKKNKYLLVIIDGFTKFVFLEPVKDTKSKHVIKAITDIMYLFGVPIRIISDRGTAFTSHTFKLFCTNYGIRHVLNAVATPRANGQCERVNRTILGTLAATAAGSSEHKWDLHVKNIQSAINLTVNKTTGVSPLEVLAGYKGRAMAESKILGMVQQNFDKLDLQTLRNKVAERITKEQKKDKERFDRKRAEAKVYVEGEVVMVQKTDSPATGSSKKLLAKYKGPFKVTKVLPNDRYEVVDLREGMKNYRTIVAVDKMKPWIVLKGENNLSVDM